MAQPVQHCHGWLLDSVEYTARARCRQMCSVPASAIRVLSIHASWCRTDAAHQNILVPLGTCMLKRVDVVD